MFAQVSNPPLDPIREKIVTQMSILGWKRENLLSETSDHAQLVKIECPILLNNEINKLLDINKDGIKAEKLSTTFDVRKGKSGFLNALEEIKKNAEKSIKAGSSILVLSDRGLIVRMEHCRLY